ncbi:HD domain-containing protein [candidate division TA06 bacterium]|nr:HD domain-containing protein [candidate division TA06 bacterium]
MSKILTYSKSLKILLPGQRSEDGVGLAERNGEQRILLFDSNLSRARTLAKALSHASKDWVVEFAHQDKVGFNRLKASSYDCILLQEVAFPEKRGLQILREIRKIDQSAHIVLLSSKPYLKIVLEAFHLGIFDYFSEPYSLSEVIESVRLALDKEFHQQEREGPFKDLIDEIEDLQSSTVSPYSNEIEDPRSLNLTLNLSQGRDQDHPPRPNLESSKTVGLTRFWPFGRERNRKKIGENEGGDLEDTLSKCLDLSMVLLKANKGMGIHVDQKSNSFIVREPKGFNGQYKKGSTLDQNLGIEFRTVVREGFPSWLKKEGECIACTPLGSPPHVFGLILLYRSTSYTEEDLKILSLFAHLVPNGPQNTRLLPEIKDSVSGDIQSLLLLLEAKDPQLLQHAVRVMEYSKVLAWAIGLPVESMESIKLAALLHDVGKIPSANTHGIEEVQRGNGVHHMTDRIVEALKIPDEAKVILHHRSEYFDGSGNPDGLEGEEISIGARILTIADAYDEIRSKVTNEEEIEAGFSIDSGRRFDPIVVEIFYAMRTGKGGFSLDIESEALLNGTTEPIHSGSQPVIL